MVRVIFYGYSSFVIKGERVKVIIDPGKAIPEENPIIRQEEYADTDLVLVTSIGEDHSGALPSVISTGFKVVVGPEELKEHMSVDNINFQPIKPQEEINVLGVKVQAFKASPGQIGGGLRSLFKRKSATPEGLGYLITIEERTICHLGETLLRDDWEEWRPDLLLVPIGGGTTMDLTESIMAVDKIKPRIAIPMHYNLPAGIYQSRQVDPAQFLTQIEERGFECKVLEPGHSILI